MPLQLVFSMHKINYSIKYLLPSNIMEVYMWYKYDEVKMVYKVNMRSNMKLTWDIK